MAIMWHGGNRWDGQAEIRPAKKGRAEWGPGIYGTTNYFRASQYAKGGKVTQLIEFQPRLLLSEAAIGLDTLADFVKGYAPRSKQADILERLQSAANRNKLDGRVLLGTGPMAHADVLVNMWVNTDLAHGKNGPPLSAFLTEMGIDAHTDRSMSMSGTPEYWTVVFNPESITRHLVIPAASVAQETWYLPSPAMSRDLTIEAYMDQVLAPPEDAFTPEETTMRMG